LAGQKSKRSRKRRAPGTAPRAVSSQRREQCAEREALARRDERRATRQLGTEGERPPSPFGGLPVSEFLIFVGLVGLVVWLIVGGTATLIAGIAICTIGVLEVTAREHLSGYRSHATLLAAVPAIALGIGFVSLVGTDRRDRAPLLLAVAVPVFLFLFWLLRKRFQVARQARVARPPAP
jgi:hypothetical protein